MLVSMVRNCTVPDCPNRAKSKDNICKSCKKSWRDLIDPPEPADISTRTTDYKATCTMCPFDRYLTLTDTQYNQLLQIGMRCGNCRGLVTLDRVDALVRHIA